MQEKHMQLPFRIDKETYDTLKETSRRLNVSMGRVLRVLIRRYADQLEIPDKLSPRIKDEV